MPDPFWLIVGFIAIACVLLFPLRMWIVARRRHDADDEPGGDPVPLAPPERKNRGERRAGYAPWQRLNFFPEPQ